MISECACLHKAVNVVVFFAKSNENTYQQVKALMQTYIVVPKTKIANTRFHHLKYTLVYKVKYVLHGRT